MNAVLTWLTDAAHWSGDDGIPDRILEHLAYSLVAVLIAAVIAIPLGLFIGHTGRGCDRRGRHDLQGAGAQPREDQRHGARQLDLGQHFEAAHAHPLGGVTDRRIDLFDS